MKVRNRSVRVFLSSTFRDFGEERNLLVKRVFPSLRARLRSRFVELVDVDLRWGIGTEEAERGEVLPICLTEIDRSRPYFIGLLGERYGWIPPPDSYSADLLQRQPWLKTHQGGKSVTELEILHGVLNNRSMHGRARFYFRSPSYAYVKGGDYLPSVEDRLRQAELKRRVRASGLPVTSYATPEALAKRIERDLWKLLDAEFPAALVPDPFERESQRHEAYAASLQRFFLGGAQQRAALEEALRAKVSRILIEGDSAVDSSSLLANVSSLWRQRHRRHLVHEHYMGASLDAADPYALVRRLIEFIVRATGSREAVPRDPQDLMDSLPVWLAIAGEWVQHNGTRLIFVLDGLSSLSSLQDLWWWPALLPKGVTVVVSCLPGAVLSSLRSKTEADRGKIKAPGWKTVSVRPLTRAESAESLTSYLRRFSKKLPTPMVRQVKTHPLANNPLFIRTLAEELRLFGVHEGLQERLTYYLDSRTIEDLFWRVLERVEADCDGGLVKAALAAIWASRAGLTEHEIRAIANLTPAAWAAIRYELNEALIEIGGQITFAHDNFRAAVVSRYLHSEANQHSARRVVAQWFSLQQPSTRRAQEEPWQLHKLGDHAKLQQVLMIPEIFLALWESSQTEVLGYWRDHWQGGDVLAAYEGCFERWSQWCGQHGGQARVWPRLVAALADALLEAGIFSHFGASIQLRARDLVARREGARTVAAARRDTQCAFYLRHLADPGATKCARRAVRVLEPIGVSQWLVEAYMSLALCLASDNKNEEAFEIYFQARDAFDQLPESPSKVLIKHTLLLGRYFLPDNYLSFHWDKKATFAELVEEEERALGRENRRTLESVDLLVGSLLESGDFERAAHEAMSLYLRCHRAFGEGHLQTGYAAGKYGIAKLELNDLVSAEWGLSKAVEILKRSFPEGHPSRTSFHDGLAKCLNRSGKTINAQVVIRELKQQLISQYFYVAPTTKI